MRLERVCIVRILDREDLGKVLLSVQPPVFRDVVHRSSCDALYLPLVVLPKHRTGMRLVVSDLANKVRGTVCVPNADPDCLVPCISES